ncbi:metallophosphoesterase [Sporolactobacillus laevolacticus]|uniref:Ser/Thr phosphatase n=1 Tax=Sporolactobacillus laevolacticus DSM 442 TaxID=1395513 RepID=V6J1S1_9BACL|nr:metallophosphoesterase [Sporolactobacillus laevolacticus]EST10694.1 Ser/Thr phosphatase [Sporolactobacillus laevolacticus DSM 442]
MSQIYKKLTRRPRILAISDIHGHLGGLKLLLKVASYSPKSDQLYLLGDYIDEPADTWQTLNEIEHLCLQGAAAIPGNKELEWLADQEHQETKHPAYYFVQGLPLYIKSKDYLFVHAGIRPGIKMKDQTAKDCTTIREPFLFTDPHKKRTIIFGHTPTYRLGSAPGQIWHGEGKIDIDTGAKHNVRLTLVDLTNRLAYSCSTAPERRYGSLRINEW